LQLAQYFIQAYSSKLGYLVMKQSKQLKPPSGNKITPQRAISRAKKSAESQSSPLQKITAKEFANRFAHGVGVSEQPFTWFLGAGCSKSSGILDASGLVEKWLSEEYKLEGQTGPDFQSWAKTQFPTYDASSLASLYAAVFARRHPSPVERQREIEMICARGEPAYGYATLAQILSHKEYGRHCNTVLTTNFDDLIADALYLYGERHARPLVVTHEALARYVRTNSPRPTVVKLHGDAHLDPKNLQPETREIDVELSGQLYPFLQDHALVFVGYGGNDESILKFVKNCPVPALAPSIFWVSKKNPPAPFATWLFQRNALQVDHTDFDQLMHLIRSALNIELLDRKRWNRISEVYYKAFESLKGEIEKITIGSQDADALKKATSETQKSLPDDWNYYSRVESIFYSDPAEAKQLLEEGLKQFPDSAKLNTTYGMLLALEGKIAVAEHHLRRATEIDPSSFAALNHYGVFLLHHRGDVVQAEQYIKRALETEAESSDLLGNYAQVLLAKGETERGLLFLERAHNNQKLGASETLAIELLIYRYAHEPSNAPNILRQLKRLLVEGKRSPGWRFDSNLARAEKDGHPNIALLRDLILVATNRSGIETLDAHPVWRALEIERGK
jgi:Tfp pilus assembly protein PilF